MDVRYFNFFPLCLLVKKKDNQFVIITLHMVEKVSGKRQCFQRSKLHKTISFYF